MVPNVRPISGCTAVCKQLLSTERWPSETPVSWNMLRPTTLSLCSRRTITTSAATCSAAGAIKTTRFLTRTPKTTSASRTKPSGKWSRGSLQKETPPSTTTSAGKVSFHPRVSTWRTRILASKIWASGSLSMTSGEIGSTMSVTASRTELWASLVLFSAEKDQEENELCDQPRPKINHKRAYQIVEHDSWVSLMMITILD